jgi:uncharacterized membrane protein YeaQ/YmgE (transglycosylase-associated protein family)
MELGDQKSIDPNHSLPAKIIVINWYIILRRIQMGILSWVVLGLVAGLLARFFMPGKQGYGIILTIVLGIVGAVVGGWISTLLGFGTVNGFNLGSIVIAVIGALVVLVIFGFIKKKR